MLRFLLIAIVCLPGMTANAQEFPWGIFQPRSLEEVLSFTREAVRPDDSMFFATNHYESKVQVEFTGKSRPLLEVRRTFISTWAEMLGHPKTYADLYEREYLYKEGTNEYWLATSKPITKYFDKELKVGDAMTLYLISIGAYRTKGTIDCVLLVEEYQKPKVPKANSQ